MPSAKTKQNPANENSGGREREWGVGGGVGQGWLLSLPQKPRLSTYSSEARGSGGPGVQGSRKSRLSRDAISAKGAGRVPAAGKGRPGERRPGAMPTHLPDSREGAPLTLGPQGASVSLGPCGVAGEETKGTGLELDSEESWGAGCG